MTDLSALPPRERANRNLALAQEAREKAALSTSEAQISLVKLALQWMELAAEADIEAKAEGS